MDGWMHEAGGSVTLLHPFGNGYYNGGRKEKTTNRTQTRKPYENDGMDEDDEAMTTKGDSFWHF